jgi:hypothetical protein
VFGPAETLKTITVPITDDVQVEGNETFTVTLSTPSPANSGVIVGGPATGTIVDNDSPGVFVTPVAVNVTEGGATDTYTVRLTKQPVLPVTITATADADLRVNGGTSANLVFTVLNWNVEQPITVTAFNDSIDEPSPHAGTITHVATSASPLYDGVAVASVTAAITDNDNLAPELSVVISNLAGAAGLTYAPGETVRVNGTIAKAGEDAHTVEILWGDGSPLVTFDLAAGQTTFTRNHVFTSEQTPLIRITVDDGDGGSDMVQVPLNITNAGGGNGSVGVGLVDPTQGMWHLYDTGGIGLNALGDEITSFFYGNPGDFPVMGDWDCDGVDTPGMYRQSDGFVYLRNSNTQGIADIRFFFGNPGDIPIVGDFDGDGCDTVSIFRPSEGRAFIINELGQNEGGLGAADFSYYFGNPGDKPFVGDFDADGEETIGLHRESTGLVYFRNSHTAGPADHQFIFGDPNDRLVAGDWGIVNGVDTAALFRPGDSTFYFRFTNTQGVADATMTVGQPGWLPVAGSFGS